MTYTKESHPHYTLWHDPPNVIVTYGDPLFINTTSNNPLDAAIHAILSSALFYLGFEDFQTLASIYTKPFRTWAFPTFTPKTRFKASIPASLVHNWLRRAFEKEGLDVPSLPAPDGQSYPLPTIPDVKLPPLDKEDYDNYLKNPSTKYKKSDYHPKKKGKKHHARQAYEE